MHTMTTSFWPHCSDLTLTL